MLLFDKLGIVPRPVRINSSLGRFSAYDGNLLGGALVGISIALSGACPGTVVIQPAQGIPSAQPTALGALLGGGVYVYLKHILQRAAPPAVYLYHRNAELQNCMRCPSQ